MPLNNNVSLYVEANRVSVYIEHFLVINDKNTKRLSIHIQIKLKCFSN